MWDGIGSVLVGVLLAGVAVYLIQRNRSFLIGRSMVREDFQKIVRHLKRDPVIKNIYEAKSEEIGEGIFRFSLPLTRTCAGDLYMGSQIKSPSVLRILGIANGKTGV